MLLGLGALGIMVWTRASDMPEPRAQKPAAAVKAAPEVVQSFPAAPASLRHISAVLAFDALRVEADNVAPQPLELGAQVPGGSQLIFQLYNRSPQSAFFLIFGVDAQQRFSWVYPPKTASGGVSRSLPLAAVPVVELPEPLTLPDDVSTFTLVGVFTDAPVTVDEVKQAWQSGGAQRVQISLHAQVQVLPLNTQQP